MKHALTTTSNHTPKDLTASQRIRAAQTHAAMVTALARVGGETVEWGMRCGAYLDSARLAIATIPDARLFGRIESNGSDRAPLGVTVLIDSSGSMGDPVAQTNPESRRDAARAIAVGIVSACDALGLPVAVGHHGADGQTVSIAAHRTTRGVLRGPWYGSNLDAPAVAAWLDAVEMPAERHLFLLVCDGAPCYATGSDAGTVAKSLRALDGRGGAFCLAYIGDDDYGLNRAAADWSAMRVADCRATPMALVPTIIRAVNALRTQ